MSTGNKCSSQNPQIIHYVVYNASPSNAAPIPKTPAKATLATFPAADEAEVAVVGAAEVVEALVVVAAELECQLLAQSKSNILVYVPRGTGSGRRCDCRRRGGRSRTRSGGSSPSGGSGSRGGSSTRRRRGTS